MHVPTDSGASPFFLALSFIDTTSEPELASLIAKAPTWSPVINWQQETLRWDNRQEIDPAYCFRLLWSWPLASTSPSAVHWRGAPAGWHRGWSGRRSRERHPQTLVTAPPSQWHDLGNPGLCPHTPLREIHTVSSLLHFTKSTNTVITKEFLGPVFSPGAVIPSRPISPISFQNFW